MTPFEKAGYTKDTKFRVLSGRLFVKKGDIVTLDRDDGSNCPFFKTEDDNRCYMYLPNTSRKGFDEELEVYEEPLTKDLTPFEEAGHTEDTNFRVLRDDCIFNKGDIVNLYYDTGTTFPYFKTKDDRVCDMYLPGMTPKGLREKLEVYEEPLTKYLITTLNDNIVMYAKNIEEVSLEINKMGIEVVSVGEIKDLNIEKITEYKITEV